jgi:hypothetical protein
MFGILTRTYEESADCDFPSSADDVDELLDVVEDVVVVVA